MAKILFQINYDVKPEKRDDYLLAIKELQRHIRESSNKNYLVLEDKNKKNNFTELYICENEEEYESIEDNMDDKTFELTKRLFNDFIAGSKPSYFTFYEVD